MIRKAGTRKKGNDVGTSVAIIYTRAGIDIGDFNDIGDYVKILDNPEQINAARYIRLKLFTYIAKLIATICN